MEKHLFRRRGGLLGYCAVNTDCTEVDGGIWDVRGMRQTIGSVDGFEVVCKYVDGLLTVLCDVGAIALCGW